MTTAEKKFTTLLSLPQSSDNPWIALVGPEIEENLSLRYLSSSLAQAGYPSHIIPFNSSGELSLVLQTLLHVSVPPMIIALSLSFQWRAMDFIGLAVALKENGYNGHITGGGHFGTFAAEEILRDFPEIDSICLHESEEIIVHLARTLHAQGSISSVKGIAIRLSTGEIVYTEQGHQPELSDLPWPDRRGEPSSCLGHKIAAFVAGRGCYANCAFCCIAAWHRKVSPGKPFRRRSVEDIADEMTWLNKNLGIEIFIFHDDNFFLPNHEKTLEYIVKLADELDKRGIGKFATVVKARPNDITHNIFSIMIKRLGLIRLFLGVETDSAQGLKTLKRNIESEQNHRAMEILEALRIYVCFNMLIFDPDTTVENLLINLEFMEQYAHFPFNFGRVELYAGTPILARMQQEGRCWGDYLGWDYSLTDPEIQRICELTMKCFYQRNFYIGAMANRLMGTRFDVEVCRYFHPEYYHDSWLQEVQAINKKLAYDSIKGIKEIINFVQQTGRDDDKFINELSQRLHSCEKECEQEAHSLEDHIQNRVGKYCHHSRQVNSINV